MLYLVVAKILYLIFATAGEQYDAITDLYYLRARQYDTILGRFTQEDTYLGDGRNLFAYVSSNPLKYVDPSGHDKEMGYGIFEKNTYRDMLITDFALGQQEKAKENLIWEGVAEVAKGGLQTASGGLVFGAGVVVMPIHPVIGVSGATVGSGYANMGISNMSEGVQKIYNGFTGNVDVPTFNPTRDTFFGGSQTNYNYAQAILGGTNFIYGVGLPNLPTGLPSGGSIMEYANAGSQMLDFLDAVEETSGNGGSAQGLLGHDFEEYLTQVIGGEGSFSAGGRDFDGGLDNRWWEAKSGGFWDMLSDNPRMLDKFKSDMGDRLKIANENGASYELFSFTPIPESIKNWLTRKGIPFTEFLE